MSSRTVDAWRVVATRELGCRMRARDRRGLVPSRTSSAQSRRQRVRTASSQLDDPAAGAEALRHVLVGGTPSVSAFADEVADAEGGDVLRPHMATRIIGEVLAEIDTRAQ